MYCADLKPTATLLQSYNILHEASTLTRIEFEEHCDSFSDPITSLLMKKMECLLKSTEHCYEEIQKVSKSDLASASSQSFLPYYTISMLADSIGKWLNGYDPPMRCAATIVDDIFCPDVAMRGGRYCFHHTCQYDDCTSANLSDKVKYCQTHRCTVSTCVLGQRLGSMYCSAHSC